MKIVSIPPSQGFIQNNNIMNPPPTDQIQNLENTQKKETRKLKKNTTNKAQLANQKMSPVQQSKKSNAQYRPKEMNLIWLTKFFLYRHESLNKYLNVQEFRRTMDSLSENYQKQLIQYHKIYSNGIRKTMVPKGGASNNVRKPVGISPSESTPTPSENQLIKVKTNINPVMNNSNNTNPNVKTPQKIPKKSFIVLGGYPDVSRNLQERGWVREKNPKSLNFSFLWSLKTNDIIFAKLKANQLVNHFFKNGQITRKSGLNKNIKNLYYKGIDPMNFFPRCYDLSIKDELEDFKQDFKFTWAMSLLKLFMNEIKEKREDKASIAEPVSSKFSSKTISVAINIISRNLSLFKCVRNLKQWFTNLNIIKNDKSFLVTDEEWDIIYLQELTQHSNVKEIIYEVNSNKPGGVNNPIKSPNGVKIPNKQQKIISGSNETKNLLISTKGMPTNETKGYSTELKSTYGLKSKASAMEKNNDNTVNISKKYGLNYDYSNPLNINDNGNIVYNKSDNPAQPKPKQNLNLPMAKFNEFQGKVEMLLNDLEKVVPQYKLNGHRNIWIMKPSNLSRGRGVTCVDSLAPIEESLSATNDVGLIVQKYIENPMIIRERKFDIRQWVLVTSLCPLKIWIWKEPYLRFGAEDYKMEDLGNIYSHLTNNSIAKHSAQFNKEKKFEGDMWTCQDFANYIGKDKWEMIHEKIKNAIICSFFAAHHEINHRNNSHELFGYDFMIDENCNVYLIEVNASPALDYSTKITERAVKSMVNELMKMIIDNNNAKNYNNPDGKFVEIFNESIEGFKPEKYIPNKSLFH